jgi:hypothetical protein
MNRGLFLTREYRVEKNPAKLHTRKGELGFDGHLLYEKYIMTVLQSSQISGGGCPPAPQPPRLDEHTAGDKVHNMLYTVPVRN